MSTWGPAVPYWLLAVLLVFGPGTAVLVASGAPWRRAVLFAPGPSVGLVATTAIVADVAGVRFGIPVVLLATAGAAVAGAVLARGARRLRGAGVVPPLAPATTAVPRRPRSRSPRDYALPLAWVLAAVLLTRRLAEAIGAPDRISQTIEAVYHLNTTRHVLATGDGSSLGLAGWDTGGSGFAASAWHDLAALVAAIGGDVPVATQALALVVGAVVWPLSVLLMVRQLVGPSWAALLGVGALLPAVGLFPAWMLQYGVSYDLLLGIALAPSLVAIVGMVVRPVLPRPAAHLVHLLIAAAAAVLGLLFAHPGALASAVLVLLPLLLAAGASSARRRWAVGRRLNAVVIAVGVVLLACGALIWVGTAPDVELTRIVDLPGADTPAQAVGAWLTMSPSSRLAPWVVTLLTLAGIGVAAGHRGLRWLVAAYVLCAVPYVLAAGLDPDLAQRLTGAWGNDPALLAAVLPITGLPLAGVALAWLARWPRRALLAAADRIPRRFAPWVVPVGGTLLVTVLLLVSAGGLTRERYDALAETYRVPTQPVDRTLLTADERDLLERLPELLPAGARVAANPWDGSGLAYAVAGVPVLVAQLDAYPGGQAAEVVAQRLNQVASDPAVCAALDELGIRYALDFGAPVGTDPHSLAYPGLTRLSSAPGIELVDSVGRARLYEVTACGELPPRG
ncbi:DUF6541 family protein [Modestobacter sp. SYSU DS0511]